MISIANYFGVPLESLYGTPGIQRSSKKDPKAVEDVFNRILTLSKAERTSLLCLVENKYKEDV
jgi:hypothetical protein